MSSMPGTYPQQHTAGVRIIYLILGWLFFCLGMLGVLLPVLPTTPFLLLSLWGFSKSSLRLHNWLYEHHTFGPPLRRWDQHRIIPLHAKWLIVVTMSASLVYVTGFSDMPAGINFVIAIVMIVVATYLISRPSSLKPENEQIE